MNIIMKNVGLESVDIIQKILESAPFYNLMTEGEELPSSNAAKDALTTLPPNTTEDKKHFFIFQNYEKTPIGVADLVIGYPNDETAFLGLLLLDENYQKRHLGTDCFSLLLNFINSFNQIKCIQIGVVENNPVEGFWKKMGFERNGRSRPYKGKSIESTVFVMEKYICA